MPLWRFGHAAYRSRSKTQEAFVAFAMRSVRLRISIHGARGGRMVYRRRNRGVCIGGDVRTGMEMEEGQIAEVWRVQMRCGGAAW